MADGSRLIQWPCNCGANQRWNCNASSGLIRSMQDPHFFMDNACNYGDGGGVLPWFCNGNSNQRSNYDEGPGTLAIRNHTIEVIDASGADAGSRGITWSFWRSDAQRWNRVRRIPTGRRKHAHASMGTTPNWSPPLRRACPTATAS